MPGYKGWLTLVSPSGETKTIWLHGRTKYSGDAWPDEVCRATRYAREFYSLLSAGWKVRGRSTAAEVEAAPQAAEDGESGEEDKKDTSEVDGSTKTGRQSHGGDHASGEVENSPNAAKNGKRPRGKRGGRGHGQAQEAPKDGPPLRKHGSTGVYTFTGYKPTEEALRSAKESAELLARLIGRSALKIRAGTRVDTQRLVLGLETEDADEVLKALDTPAEKRKLKILVSEDRSGSCSNWSAVGGSWAVQLATLPDVEVFHVENSNGMLMDMEHEEVVALLGNIDLMVYLGDRDGRRLCEQYASKGATVVAMDCYAACARNPRLRATKHGTGVLYWVDRVSSHHPEGWVQGLRMALSKAF